MTSSMRRYARSVATMMSALLRSSATIFVTRVSDGGPAALPPAGAAPPLMSKMSFSRVAMSPAVP